MNVSARASAGSGDSTLIAGVYLKGETPVTLLFRGIGPALSQFGVSGVVANPTLAILRGATLMAVNDNWSDVGAQTLANAAAAVGAFALPPNSRDAAILATLEPGAYTVQLSTMDTAGGIALIEIYEVP